MDKEEYINVHVQHNQQNKEAQQNVQEIKQTNLKYYRKSDVIKGHAWNTFDLRFDEIKNSFVDSSLLNKSRLLYQWQIRQGKENKGIPTDLKLLEEQLPIVQPSFPESQDKITYTWIGHSTAIISFGKDANFIIDPVFSDRCSPNQWVGPKRFRSLPCSFQQMPKIDVVLVSHDHFDHLDEQALKKISNKNQNCIFFAGLNSKSVFPKGCILNEMDWTYTKEIQIKDKKFKITFVPVCHWSRRGLADYNYRLWGGFVIQTPTKKKIFYSGDTGYCGIFKEIGQIFNGFDLSILPIGAYLPRKYLSNQHIDPAQAVKIHKQIKSKKSVGVHWGTFPLGYQHYCAAPKDLKKALEEQNIDENEFITVNHGGHFQIDY